MRDAALEIVTGGSYFDGTRWVAQLHVWNGATLAVEEVQAWYWTSQTLKYVLLLSVMLMAMVLIEIVTGGSYNDGTRWIAQLLVWNGATWG